MSRSGRSPRYFAQSIITEGSATKRHRYASSGARSLFAFGKFFQTLLQRRQTQVHFSSQISPYWAKQQQNHGRQRASICYLQSDLQAKAFEAIQSSVIVLSEAHDFSAVIDKVSTENNNNNTLLEKHLNSFISINSFDYFIHKDLGNLLCRELDFYIKSEVLYLDDINIENLAFFTAQLSKIKALKTVSTKIIVFLAQIEDFQKKCGSRKSLSSVPTIVSP